MCSYNFLFNFAVTKTGGGLKRLYAYSKWFNKNGGAYFIIHPQCEFLKQKFTKNKYFIVFQSNLERVFFDCRYLIKIKEKINKPDLYYSYGIPIYYYFGKINWLHLSNILPFMYANMGLSFFDKNIRLSLLRWKMKKNFINTDIVSAESKNSLQILKNNNIKFFFLSKNGSDDELNYLQNNSIMKKENIAVVVGTQRYKNLIEAYKIFKILKKKNNFLKLVLIGDHNNIHKHFLNSNEIIIKGAIKQNQVIKILKKAAYFISTTKIENSFNSASEGIFLADESYISDIGPHRELLENEKYDIVTFPTLKSKFLNVKRKNLKGKNLKSWNGIILEMIKKVNNLNHLSKKQ